MPLTDGAVKPMLGGPDAGDLHPVPVHQAVGGGHGIGGERHRSEHTVPQQDGVRVVRLCLIDHHIQYLENNQGHMPLGRVKGA